MEKNYDIENFVQHLYEKYDMPDKSISYGYNSISESYIVKIGDAPKMGDERLQEDLFNFCQRMAENGDWVVFVSSEDPVNFNDYAAISRNQVKEVAKDYYYQAIQSLAFSGSWAESSSIGGKGETREEGFTGDHNLNYAIAA
jgi:hypothetical protein